MENREIPIDPSAFDYIQLQYDDAVNDDALDYADALLDEGECADPFEAVAQEELRSQFWRMVMERVGNLRDISIFVARALDGKTYRDIGKRYGMSGSNAQRICDRVYRAMRGYPVFNMLFEHGFEEEVYRAAVDRSYSWYYSFSDNVREYFRREHGYLTYRKQWLLGDLRSNYDDYGHWNPPCTETEEPTEEVIEEVAKHATRVIRAALTEEPTEEVTGTVAAWLWGSAPIHHFLTTNNKYTFKIIDKMRIWSALLKDSRYLNALYITYEHPDREYCVEFERMSIKRDLQKVVIKGKLGYHPASIEIELYEFLDVLGLSADLLNQPEDQISSTIVDAIKRIAYSNPASTC